MKKILITGGTGSFGKAMVERLLQESNCPEIVVFSRDELKQHDMRITYSSPKLKFVVGDIRNSNSLRRAMNDVDTIFHAAALKQVPTGEFYPSEMVDTNVLGTKNVFDVAHETPSVKKVVLLSTDKAVYPINTMGISKALAERFVADKHYEESSTVYTAVRYGNVMASRGSVIPLFVEKIKNGEVLTITDPTMTRFLLSLTDAIELVLLAIEKGEHGDLFIKKAPAANMQTLTQALLNIFEANNKIKIVGTRAGEKIHETLATQFELARAEDLGEHYKVKSQMGDNPGDFFDQGYTATKPTDYTSENTKQLSVEETERALLELEYIKKQLCE